MSCHCCDWWTSEKYFLKTTIKQTCLSWKKASRSPKKGWLFVWKKTKKRQQNKEKFVSEFFMHQHLHTFPSWLFFVCNSSRSCTPETCATLFHWCMPGFYRPSGFVFCCGFYMISYKCRYTVIQYQVLFHKAALLAMAKLLYSLTTLKHLFIYYNGWPYPLFKLLC